MFDLRGAMFDVRSSTLDAASDRHGTHGGSMVPTELVGAFN
jgi:hypothetical protein